MASRANEILEVCAETPNVSPQCWRWQFSAAAGAILASQLSGRAGVSGQLRLASESIILQGLCASFRSKLYCIAHGWPISLGTIGVERLWRKRRARNRGRSGASPDTVDLLLTFRWLREVSGRVAASRNRSSPHKLTQAQLSRQNELQDLAEFLGSVMCPSTSCDPPLALAKQSRGGVEVAKPPKSESQICGIYHMLVHGCL